MICVNDGARQHCGRRLRSMTRHTQNKEQSYRTVYNEMKHVTLETQDWWELTSSTRIDTQLFGDDGSEAIHGATVRRQRCVNIRLHDRSSTVPSSSR